MSKNNVNKARLVEEIQKKVPGINKKQAEKMLLTLTDTIIDELKRGRDVTIAGFGTFTSFTRHARGGVNPRNPKERITIPAVKVAKFRTGKNLKDALKS